MQMLATWIAILIAGASVYFGAQIYRETKRLRQVETEPDLAVYLEPGEAWIGFFYLVIRNIGRGPAYSVSFALTGPVEDDRIDLQELGLLRLGLGYMAPSQELRTFFGSALELFQEPALTPIGITVSYVGADKTRYKVPFTLDVAPFRGLVQVGTPPPEEIATAMKALAKDVHSTLRSTPESRLGVEIKTTSETRDERRQRREDLERRHRDTDQWAGPATSRDHE